MRRFIPYDEAMWRFVGMAGFVAGCAMWPFHSVEPRPVPVTLTAADELLVDARIDGEPFLLQLDTGAITTTLAPDAMRRLKPQRYHGASDGAYGAGGQFAPQIGVVRCLAIGGREAYDLPVAVAELPAGGSVVDGLLGQDVLARYIADIDLSGGGHRLVLRSHGDDAWRTPDLVAIPFRRTANHLMRIDAELDGVPVAAVVDLGSASTVVSSRAAGERVAVRIGHMVGIDGHPITTGVVSEVKLVVGGANGITLEPPRIVVADLPIFERLEIRDRVPIILGVDALRARRIVIAPREHRLYLSR